MVQWFPGHMAKARRLITENLKLVDVVTELADARLPASSRNPLLDELIGDKPRLLVLTKEDLADNEGTKAWLKYYNDAGLTALSVDASRGTRVARQSILDAVRKKAEGILLRRQGRGIINKTVRTMVVGIPNVGKSTLINFLAGQGAAGTGDKPGVTRGKQWIRLGKDVELLDMPGLLWPKIEDRETGNKLAATGAVSDQVFDREEIVLWLLGWLKAHTPGRLKGRYKVEEDQSPAELLVEISKRRGFLRAGGEIDREKSAVMIIDEFRGGKLGVFTMDDKPERDSDGMCPYGKEED